MIMTAIKSKYLLNNRSDKRLFAKEATTAAEYLQHIIDDFVEFLFIGHEKYDYRVIYLHFLDLWHNTCDHLKKVIKLKSVQIDVNFFAREYSPKV